MFTRVFAVASLAALAVANPLAVRGAQCSNGAVQCCQQTQKSSTFFSSFGKNVVAAVTAEVDALVGLQCSPLTVIGVSSGCQANQQAVCCDHNDFNGVVNFGCSNVNLGL